MDLQRWVDGSLWGHEKESVWAVSEGCYGWEISGALVLNKKSYILEGNYS